jgi:hypothetical protein
MGLWETLKIQTIEVSSGLPLQTAVPFQETWDTGGLCFLQQLHGFITVYLSAALTFTTTWDFLQTLFCMF